MVKDFLQSGWIPTDMKNRKTYVWFDKSGKKYTSKLNPSEVNIMKKSKVRFYRK